MHLHGYTNVRVEREHTHFRVLVFYLRVRVSLTIIVEINSMVTYESFLLVLLLLLLFLLFHLCWNRIHGML